MLEIPEIFKKLGFYQQVSPGKIVPEGDPVTHTSREAVFEQLKSFGGEGWICFADKLLISGKDNDWQGQDYGPVLSAELYDGSISLHLRQDGVGWKQVKLIADEQGDGWIVNQDFIRKDWKETESNSTVKYVVGWDLDVNGIYRATRSRFIGFGGKS